MVSLKKICKSIYIRAEKFPFVFYGLTFILNFTSILLPAISFIKFMHKEANSSDFRKSFH